MYYHLRNKNLFKQQTNVDTSILVSVIIFHQMFLEKKGHSTGEKYLTLMHSKKFENHRRIKVYFLEVMVKIIA